MSSEWITCEIGQLCSIGSSKRIFAHDYVQSGVPFYASKDVIDKAYGLFKEPSAYIAKERFAEVSRKYGSPRKGDLLLSSVGNRAGIAYVVQDEGEFYFKDGNITWFRDFKSLDSDFLCYWLRSSVGQDALASIMIGSAQKALTISGLQKLKITVPQRPQQKQIAYILKSLDERIALLRGTNATLEAIAQALFKSWFVDFEPVHARARGEQLAGLAPEVATLFPDSFEESELGMVPKGWMTGSLNSLALLNPESWTVKNRPDSVAYVDLANAKENVIAEITEFLFEDAPSRARRVLRDGDTIVGTVRPGNRSYAFISNPLPNLTGSTGFAVLRPKQKAVTEFVYLAATANSSIEYLAHVADGGAYPAVRPEVVSNLPCVVPSYDVLNAFHAVAAPLFAKVAANHQQAQTITTLRDTLLPRLISGQLRLPSVDI